MENQTTKPRKQERPSDHYDLTEEEKKQVIEAALKQASNEKAAKIREKEYWDRVYAEEKKIKSLTWQELKAFVLKKAKKEIPQYALDQYREPVFDLLAQYFTGSMEFERAGYSLEKGLMLFGNIGCGKTTMMQLFSANTSSSYIVYSSRKVAGDYMKSGYESLSKYCNIISSSPNIFKHTHYGVCFDDLGTESSKKHFGNDINCMKEVLLNRYDQYQLKGRTHITTNLTGGELKECYGSRLGSRMVEMFNVIEFHTEANDLRL